MGLASVICIDATAVKLFISERHLSVGVGVSLALSPARGTLVLVLGCLLQPQYENWCLVSLHCVIPCSVDISGRLAAS